MSDKRELDPEDVEVLVGDVSTLTEFRDRVDELRARARSESRHTDNPEVAKGLDVLNEVLDNPDVVRRFWHFLDNARDELEDTETNENHE